MLHRLTAELFKALAHPARTHIIDLLRDREMCVCDIIAQLNMEQSNVSQHLSILKKHNLVTSRKDGLQVMYRLSFPEVLRLIDDAGVVLEKQLAESSRALQQLQSRARQ